MVNNNYPKIEGIRNTNNLLVAYIELGPHLTPILFDVRLNVYKIATRQWDAYNEGDVDVITFVTWAFVLPRHHNMHNLYDNGYVL
jgi:hypothetical protein